MTPTVAYEPWLEPHEVEDDTDPETGVRHYRRVRGGGRFPALYDPWYVSITTALKVVGKGWGYDNWIAAQERDAWRLRIAETLTEAVAPEYFLPTVAAKVGKRYVYQTVRDDAADDGKAVHEAARRFLVAELGLGAPAAPKMSPAGLVQFSAFVEWWRGSGLKAVRMEQPVMDSAWGTAGAFDLLAEHPQDGLGIVDLKATKYISDTYHLQVAAYMRCASHHDDIRWGKIVKLPKSGRGLEVHALGEKMFCGSRTREQCELAFYHALQLWKGLNRGPA